MLCRLGQANCTVQLQPITRLAGWEASGTWVLNAARIIAAGSAMDKNQIHVLQLQRGTWLLAGKRAAGSVVVHLQQACMVR